MDLAQSFKIVVALVFGLLVSPAVFSQGYVMKKHSEFVASDGWDPSWLIPWGEDGFLAMGYLGKAKKGETNWRFIHYDSDFERLDSADVVLPKGDRIRHQAMTETQTAVIYFNRVKRSYVAFVFQEHNTRHQRIEGEFPGGSQLHSIWGNGDFFLLNISTWEKRKIYRLDPGTKTMKKIFLAEVGYRILSPENPQDDGMTGYLISPGLWERKPPPYVKVFEGGEPLLDLDLSQTDLRDIRSCFTTKVADNSYFVAGAYAQKVLNNEQGIYLAHFKGDQRKWIKFFDYGDFKQFPTAIQEDHDGRVEFRVQDYMMHPVRLRQDRFYLIGERFLGMGYNDNPSYLGDVNFIGYQQTDLFVICLDLEGKLLWDVSMEMYFPYKTTEPDRKLKVEFNENGIDLLYANRSEVVARTLGYDGDILKESRAAFGASKVPLETFLEMLSEMIPSHGNHFLCLYWDRAKKEAANGKKKTQSYHLSEIVLER